ncbi:GNAT family N-acetyltransferase [Halorussus amylolyticus]|uniref:GNAT family N-acetyltransferase n=1 Tax=Halorussus amylolyticus TaxID=1126242 RepID=UPI00104573C9|nr:GNAT family N-acetyltransferase [Halorussus amylolyticus]
MSADLGSDADPEVGEIASDAERSDGLPTPPRTITDGENREIRLRVADDSTVAFGGRDGGDDGDDRAALAAMYDDFETADRAQGIPPADPDRRSRWLDRIRDGVEVLACHDDRVVGHGVLLAGGPGHELALFVHPEYRGAGVGTHLLETLLGHGASVGVERVWLSVQRTNRPAVRLYRNAGFELAASAAGEMEMRRRLRDGGG